MGLSMKAAGVVSAETVWQSPLAISSPRAAKVALSMSVLPIRMAALAAEVASVLVTVVAAASAVAAGSDFNSTQPAAPAASVAVAAQVHTQMTLAACPVGPELVALVAAQALCFSLT